MLAVISDLWRLRKINNVIAERLAREELALGILSAAVEIIVLDALTVVPDILDFIRRKRRLINVNGSRLR
jgi:hypothetical protein